MVASRKADHLLCPLVLLASFYSLLRLMIGLVALTGMAENEKDAEILALRHEVAVLRRRVKRPDLFRTDRAIFAALGTNLPAGRLMFQPATLLRWHRELVRRKWAVFQRRPRRGRPPLAEETKALILEMARENPRWGDRRIKGELLKLGIKVSATAIRMLLRAHRISPTPRRGGPTWRQFIRAHAAAIVAIDMFTIDTVLLQTLYVIVFIELGTRRLLFANCTAHPDSLWVTQQARNVAYEIERPWPPCALRYSRPRRQVHIRLRRRARVGGRGSHLDSIPRASGEFTLRKIDRKCTQRVRRRFLPMACAVRRTFCAPQTAR